MNTISTTYRVSIHASPEATFDYVSDLTRHGEWNEGLIIQALTPGPVGVGSRYHTVGRVLEKDRPNDLQVTAYQPPSRFAFLVDDPNFKDITHEFNFTAQDGGTLLTRTVTSHMPLLKRAAWRLIIFPLIDRPSMDKCLKALKANLERQNS